MVTSLLHFILSDLFQLNLSVAEPTRFRQIRCDSSKFLKKDRQNVKG